MASFVPAFRWDTHSAPNVLDFTLVPVNDPLNEEDVIDHEISIASSGKMQVQLNSVKKRFKVKMTWLTSTEKTSFMAFFNAWAKYGYAFRYLPSKEVTGTYYTVQMMNKSLVWTREKADGSGDFTYSVTFEMREQ